jgi:hypothetical protein
MRKRKEQKIAPYVLERMGAGIIAIEQDGHPFRSTDIT